MNLHCINEYFDANGNLHSYSCTGHLDSMAFRDQCEKQFAVRPLIVKHLWQKSKWIKRDPERKHSRGFSTHVSTPNFEFGAKPVTVGLIAG